MQRPPHEAPTDSWRLLPTPALRCCCCWWLRSDAMLPAAALARYSASSSGPPTTGSISWPRDMSDMLLLGQQVVQAAVGQCRCTSAAATCTEVKGRQRRWQVPGRCLESHSTAADVHMGFADERCGAWLAGLCCPCARPCVSTHPIMGCWQEASAPGCSGCSDAQWHSDSSKAGSMISTAE
jgi:hypothetical protein